MKLRLASARCCCGPTTLPCDPISGVTDSFASLVAADGGGGWVWSVPVGMTPTIQPAGTLLLDYDPVTIGTPVTFSRCSQWSASLASLRYDLSGSWTSAGYEESDGLMTGLTLNAAFLSGSTVTRAVEHRLRWQTGTGWRHQLSLLPNTASETNAFVGATIQAARTPAPVGPFSVTIALELINVSGTWQARSYWSGSLVSSVSIAAPAVSGSEFQHGFALGFSVAEASIDSWQYAATI